MSRDRSAENLKSRTNISGQARICRTFYVRTVEISNGMYRKMNWLMYMGLRLCRNLHRAFLGQILKPT
jgi:hypothetical protein